MRILCFGDSNTYGYDPRSYLGSRYPAEDRWTDLVAKQTGWDVINAGANCREIPRNPYPIRLLKTYAPVDIFLVMLAPTTCCRARLPPSLPPGWKPFCHSFFPIVNTCC